MLVSRISRRVLAEHHIALSEIHAGKGDSSGEPHVGIIFTGLNVNRSVEKCASLLRERPPSPDSDAIEPTDAQDAVSAAWPEVIVEGHLDTKFAYIREHLECV